MSILKKNALALAVIAVAGFATSVSAYTIRTDADTTPEGIARQAGTTVTMTQLVNVQIELGDALIGRTTGFQARITLLDGAQFAAGPAITLGAAAVGGWTSTLAAGGAVGGTVAQFQISPNAAGSTITQGQLFELAALQLQAVSTTTNTSIRIELIDPVTGLTIAGAVNNPPNNNYDQTRIIISRPNGLNIACTAEPNAPRIDVAGDIADANPAPSAAFVAFPWTIGGPFIGDNNLVVADNDASLGTVAFQTTNGYALDVAAAGDTASISITGTNFANLSFFAVPAAQTCLTGTVVGVFTPTVANPNQVVFNEEFADINTAVGGTFIAGPVVAPAVNGTLRICVNGDGDELAAQQLTTQAGINSTFEPTTCQIADLQKNGSVVNVSNLPPDGNPTQEGLVRIVNNSTLSGRVTIRGRDDTGAEAPRITLTLPAGDSVVYTSTELETGSSTVASKPALSNGFGNGAGRWRLNITGEFDNMQVQAYTRNVNTGTLVNITDFESNQEQTTERKNLNFD